MACIKSMRISLDAWPAKMWLRTFRFHKDTSGINGRLLTLGPFQVVWFVTLSPTSDGRDG